MRILAGFSTAEHGTLTFEGQGTTGVGPYVSTDVAAGLYCAEQMISLLGAGNYASFATAVAAAMTTSMGSSVSGSFSSTTLKYTFSKTGAGDWKIGADEVDADIARLGLFAGFSTSVTNASSITSDVIPYFILEPTIAYKSAASDDYEPDGIVTVAEADDGSSYSVSRITAPVYEDWRIVFESQATTFKKYAGASVPYTWQHFLEHVRAAHPFWVRGTNVTDTIHKMRGKAASFKPVREVADYDDHWHWPFETRVVARP